MVEETEQENTEELPLEGVGARLRLVREGKRMELGEIARITRISERHLELIERDRFTELPGRSYAFGFARSYARAMDLDEEEILDALRLELSAEPQERSVYTPGFEPGDPAKAPPRGVIWVSLLAVLLLATGSYFFYARAIAPGANPPPLSVPSEPIEAEQTENTINGVDESAVPLQATEAGPDQVVFTALEDGIWVSFYEANGRRLEQKLMALGERFIVPTDAQDPQIWTGRPDAFRITIGGQEVAKLAEQETTIRDVSITAEALRSR